MDNEDGRQSTLAAIECVVVRSRRSYDALMTAFEAQLGRWEPAVAQALVARKAPWSDVEHAVADAAGPHELVIIHHLNQGAVTSLSGRAKRCSLYLVGNPAIANRILDIDPGAAFYVPFRVCLYEDETGTAIRYERPSTFLAVLGQPALDEFGKMLDGKIETVVNAAV